MKKYFFVFIAFLMSVSLSVSSQVQLPLSIDFTNFNGINLPEVAPGWQEAKGVGNPNQFGVGGWFRADVIHPQVTAGVFINSNTHAEWMISPKFTATEHTKLSFKAALTLLWDELAQASLSFDDSLAVMYSYNGTQFFPIGFTFKYGNEPTINLLQYDVDLSNFAGQNIHIAFYATDGHIANSLAAFHLADIIIKNTSPSDAAVTKIVSPTWYQCLSENSVIEVEIKNDGHETLYSVPVRAKVRGALNSNYYGVFEEPLLPNETAILSIGGVNFSSFGEYKLTVETEVVNDGDNSNNIQSIEKLVNNQALDLPFQTLTFTDFYTNNLPVIYPGWYEARGKDFPFVQTDTDWQGDFFAGSRTASVYFIGLGTYDWMIGPKFTATTNSIIELKAAVQFDQGVNQMGSDDKLAIMVSDNCGQTWVEVGAIDKNSVLNNQFIAFNFSLSNFANQEIILAIYATTNQVNDPQSYILHIDDVSIRNVYTHDAGIIGLINPVNSCSFSNNETLTVEIKNFGTQAISNFQVGYSINDSNFSLETVSQSIPSLDSYMFTFSQTIDLSEELNNTLAVKTFLDNDGYTGNDQMVFNLNATSFDFETEGSFVMSFEEEEDFSNWVIINGNNDVRQWELLNDPTHAKQGNYSMAYFSNNTTSTSNDWLISQCFFLQEGVTYSVSFWYKNRATNYPEKLRLCLGNSQTAGSMTTVITDLGSISNSTYLQSITTFSVPISGEYYFGWHAYGPADMFGMHIDLLEVYQVFNVDLALIDAKIHRLKDESCNLINSNKLGVKVKNTGSQNVDEISIGVKVNDDLPVILNFSSSLSQNQEAIFIDQHNDIVVPNIGINTIKIWINNSNDLNAANDSIIFLEYDMSLFQMGFEEIEDSSQWTTQDLSGGNTWVIVNDASVSRTGNRCFGIRTDTGGGNTSNNDWLFSECFYLDAYKAYTLSFYYRSRFSYENLAVYIGNNNAASAMETQLFSDINFNSNAYLFAEIAVTVEESGTYYFGWNTLSSTSQKYFIYIDDIMLEETCQSTAINSITSNVLDKEVLFFADVTNATSFFWDFGDGSTSNQQNESHIYQNNGTYTATLSVSNACSQSESSIEVTIDCPVPSSSFSFSILGNTVSFFNDPEALAFLWNFGDGNFSTLQNPIHNYSGIGDYVVELIAFNQCGYSISQQIVSILSSTIYIEGTFSVENKDYDGTSLAVIAESNLILTGIENGHDVFISEIEVSFAQSHPGESILVTITSATLSGVDASNYSLSLDGSPTSFANIYPKTLYIGGSFTVENKTYDGTFLASFESNELFLLGVLEYEVVLLSDIVIEFSQTTAGLAINVLISSASITGNDSINYELSLADSPTSTANIFAKELTLEGSFTVNNKIYDGTTAATISENNIDLQGVINEDLVFIDELVAQFSQSEPANDIVVFISSAILNGSDSENYSLSLVGAPITYASIFPAEFLLTITIEGNGIVYVNSNLYVEQTYFTQNLSITLEAEPSEGWEFIEWSGDIASTNNPESLLMNENKDIIANFSTVPNVETISFSLPSIYPNPFSSFFTISNIHNVENIILSNALGQVIHTISPCDSIHNINTNGLMEGVYIIRFKFKNGEILVFKLLKI